MFYKFMKRIIEHEYVSRIIILPVCFGGFAFYTLSFILDRDNNETNRNKTDYNDLNFTKQDSHDRLENFIKATGCIGWLFGIGASLLVFCYVTSANRLKETKGPINPKKATIVLLILSCSFGFGDVAFYTDNRLLLVRCLGIFLFLLAIPLVFIVMDSSSSGKTRTFCCLSHI